MGGCVTTDVKPTNPKDAAAVHKLPLNTVPASLKVYAALAFVEGEAKYGGHNWRAAGVRASVYKAAMERHMEAWWNGEDADPITGTPHLASVIACAGIILDADLVGKLTDDRPPQAGYAALIASLEPRVAAIREMFADRAPKHFTQIGEKVDADREEMRARLKEWNRT